MTDTIADLLTRIRNAVKARHAEVTLPSSKVKLAILKVLKEKNFISDFKENTSARKVTILLKYRQGRHKTPAISQLKRMSCPGRRVYVRRDQLPSVLSGMGMVILSTSKGVMSDDEARSKNIGGELICTVW